MSINLDSMFGDAFDAVWSNADWKVAASATTGVVLTDDQSELGAAAALLISLKDVTDRKAPYTQAATFAQVWDNQAKYFGKDKEFTTRVQWCGFIGYDEKYASRLVAWYRDAKTRSWLLRFGTAGPAHYAAAARLLGGNASKECILFRDLVDEGGEVNLEGFPGVVKDSDDVVKGITIARPRDSRDVKKLLDDFVTYRGVKVNRGTKVNKKVDTRVTTTRTENPPTDHDPHSGMTPAESASQAVKDMAKLTVGYGPHQHKVSDDLAKIEGKVERDVAAHDSIMHGATIIDSALRMVRDTLKRIAELAPHLSPEGYKAVKALLADDKVFTAQTAAMVVKWIDSALADSEQAAIVAREQAAQTAAKFSELTSNAQAHIAAMIAAHRDMAMDDVELTKTAAAATAHYEALQKGWRGKKGDIGTHDAAKRAALSVQHNVKAHGKHVADLLDLIDKARGIDANEPSRVTGIVYGVAIDLAVNAYTDAMNAYANLMAIVA